MQRRLLEGVRSQEAIGNVTSALLKTDSLMGMILPVILRTSSLGLE